MQTGWPLRKLEDNKMTDLEYPACVREFYESEIFGEAASLAVLAVAKNERDRYHMGTLLQLETETKARLRPSSSRSSYWPAEIAV